MRIALSVALLVMMSGCGGGTPVTPFGVDSGPRDAAPRERDAAVVDAYEDDAFRAQPDVGPRPDAGMTSVAGGDVSGDWCGTIDVAGDVVVPVGQTLTVCAGALVRFAAGVRMDVGGTLALPGADGLGITLTSTGVWTGLRVTGTVDGAFVDLGNATNAVVGLAGSTITLNDSLLHDSDSTLALANGGTFDRTTALGGRTVTITGGVLRMVDSVIDLQHDTVSPDCTDWVGGGAVLDHVRFTGCHCPIHINSSSEELTITNSILDGAKNPIMIAESVATFTNNDLIGTSSLVLDIGDRSGIVCDVANNYWDGPAGHVAQVGTGNHAQFTGEDMVLDAPVPGAGPR